MITDAMNFAAVKTELDRVFYQKFTWDTSFPSLATAETAAIFKPMQIDRAAYVEEIFMGSPLFANISETQTVPATTPMIGNKMTTYVQDFAQAKDISKNFFDDNMFGLYSKIVEDMATKARITQTSNAFGVYRGAFTTTLTADGAALIGSHTLLNGQTYTNLITGALANSTLNDAIVALAQQPDQAGVVMGNQAKYLLVPQALYTHAVQITDSALVADSANNNLNVYRSAFGITIYTSPYLGANAGGSDSAWFLLSDNHCVTRIVRQGIQTFLRDWGMSNNRTYNYQANFREVVYCPDFVGICGSTGL